MDYQLYTAQGVLNEYEFKLTRKVLKQEFDWITDVKLSDTDYNELNARSTIFLRLVIDPIMLAETYQATFKRWVYNLITSGEGIDFIYGLNAILNIPRTESEEMNNKLNDVVASVRNSKAIPQELKLGKKRSLHVLDYEIPKQKYNVPEEFKPTSSNPI